MSAVRKVVSSLLPKHRGVAGGKHLAQTSVEQDVLPPMPQERAPAEQGDVDGPLECSLELVMVAAEALLHGAAQQAARTFPWSGTDDPVEEQRLQAERSRSKRQQIQDFLRGGSENILELTTRDITLQEKESQQTSCVLTMRHPM